MKKSLLLLSALAAFAAVADVSKFDARIASDMSLASADGLVWKDAAALPMESKVCAETSTPYGRIPADLDGRVPPGVREMGVHSTGHYFLFRTDSARLGVRWQCAQTAVTDPYIPPQGMYGVDIYVRQSGDWRFVKNGRLGADAWQETRADLPGTGLREVIVYLPIRADVKAVRLGVSEGARLEPCGHASGIVKPVVHYGTSLVHGGCASRPGLVFSSQAARIADVPYVNLGFSGQARLDLVMADVMARADASLYIVDPVWNCDVARIDANAEPFVRRLHALRPDVPILLCEGPEAGGSRLETNEALKRVYAKLKAEKDFADTLHYLPCTGMLPTDGEATHDYIHPNDYGSMRMGAVFGAAISRLVALAEHRCQSPVGISSARRAEAARQAAALIEKMTPRERLAELMMDAPGVERLGIPRYHWWNEALHGVARAGLATVFPQSMGAAASFDAPLLREVGDAISTEARAKYNLFRAQDDRRIYRGLTFWSPNVNMFRDPRWGRGQETYGEDPFLSGAMGGAFVRGLQGDDPRYLKTAACAKHFGVHSGPEALRHGFDAKVSARDMAEYYFPAFRALAEDAKVESFMGAYSAINGMPCCANRWLLTDLLRGEWGFEGHVVSDVGAVNDIFSGHKFAADKAAASKLAMAAGLDLCSEDTYMSLQADVDAGAVKPETMATPLVRLYTTRALLGMFDPDGSTPWDRLGEKDVANARHRRLALRMAEESLVLVHNDGVLPIDRSKVTCVGVAGPRDMDEVALLGNYCGYSSAPSSVLAGVTEAAGPGLKVTGWPELGDSDVLVCCLGITANDEGEEGCVDNGAKGDRDRYGLPEEQLKTLRGYRECFKAKKIVTVVFGCSPLDLKPVVELSDAVIVAWYPGERGGAAIGRTVFGLSNPSGRLPITYPKSYDDLPDFKDYALAGRTYRYATKEPLYPFGYGLSYTTFAYGKAIVEGEDRNARVSVDVTNTGKVAGDEVVQVYVRAPKEAGDRRLHHLEGFARVSLEPGETKTVRIPLGPRAFAVYGEDGKPFVPKGATTVFVGGGQPGFAANVVSTEVRN